jgi:hypothetical protein
VAPNDAGEKQVTAASDAIKQLLTIASGVLTVTITFVTDLLQNDPGNWLRITLLVSWGAFALSICVGILGLGAIPGDLKKSPPSIGGNTKWLTKIQFALFAIGIIALSVFGGAAFWDYSPTESSSTNHAATPTVAIVASPNL